MRLREQVRLQFGRRQLEGAGGVVPVAAGREGLGPCGRPGRAVHAAGAVEHPGRVGADRAVVVLVPRQAVGQGQEAAQGQAGIGMGHALQGAVDVDLAVQHGDPDQGLGDRLGHRPGYMAHIGPVVRPIALEHQLAVLDDQKGVRAAERRGRSGGADRPGRLDGDAVACEVAGRPLLERAGRGRQEAGRTEADGEIAPLHAWLPHCRW